jgi:CubicO group peptidase (beta-lactamase class C family)
MNTSFHAICAAAAERWEVPAIAVSDGHEVVALGCEPDTRFRVASVTKPLTAHLALRLLDLDAPTGVWPAEVRVRHLLAHTSGFDCELPDGDNAKYGTGDDALARCVADVASVRRFVGVDAAWSYANSGYWLAGHLAAERAGCTFEEALARHVLSAAGLEATDFGEPDLEGTGADAREGAYPRSRRPSGGLVSTVPDLVRAARWLVREGARQRVVHGKPIGGVYGLGLFGERAGGVEVWGHPGSYGGFQSTLLTIPSHDAVFVGLTNSSLGGKALRELEDAWFESVLGARRARPQFVAADPDELERYAGTYENSDARVVVERAGDGLVLQVDGERIAGRKIRARTFCVPDGEHVDERFDFPLEGFARFGSRLAVRV